eukprot:TRINITY_DN19945_c0_g1_i1.p1 TRINITY_DN19945_c0_g1~~TRINITY_DN19945_c0_g1_i1.p1  ORF type:complete len:312 (-),score=64.03 TRINITY_DN19945_c0_g1_i1:38-973(-)
MGNWFTKNELDRFPDVSAVDSVRSINGLSLDAIERRGRPLPDRTEDGGEWRFRAATGFLGPDESLTGLLRRDWHAVAELGTSHTRLAADLRSIIRCAEDARAAQHLGPMSDVELRAWRSDAAPTSQPARRLLVSRQIANGYQYSVFFNEQRPGSVLNTQWKEEYRIQCVSSGLQVCVAGNADVGLVDYIDRFGFYEGGAPGNEYRVEPSLLHAIITGRIMPKAAILWEQQLRRRLLPLEADLRECLAALDDAHQRNRNEADNGPHLVQDIDFLRDRRQHLTASLEHARGEVEQQLSRLRTHVSRIVSCIDR